MLGFYCIKYMEYELHCINYMEYELQVVQTANRMRIWSSNNIQKDVI